MKNQILRKCISCKELKNRDNLIKITLMNNEIFINGNSKIFGRSVYVCNCANCVKLLLKNKGIKRGLKTENQELIKRAEKLVLEKFNELEKEIHPEGKLR